MLPSSHHLGLSVTDLTPNSPESAKFYDDNSIFSPDSNQIFEHATIYDEDEIYSISGINEITDMGSYCNNSSGGGGNGVTVDGSASQHSFSDIADDDSVIGTKLFHHHHHHHVEIDDNKTYHHRHHDDVIVFDDVVVNSANECGDNVACNDNSNGRLHSYDFESTNIDVILTSNDANLNSASRSTTTKLPQFLHLHNSSNSNLQQSSNNIGCTNGIISTNNNGGVGGSNISIDNGGGVVVGDASDVCNGSVLSNSQYLIATSSNINTIFANLNAVLTNNADYINNDMLMDIDDFQNYDITETASSPGSHLEFDCSSEDLHQIQSTMYISDIKTEQ